MPEFVVKLPSPHDPADSAYDLRGIPLEGRFLDGVKLARGLLQGATFANSRLRGADFREASMGGANLDSAKLQGADLHGADLQGASLQGADLAHADLGSASLAGADLRQANLVDANMLVALLDSTCLSGANLGEAKNVRYIHWGDIYENRYVIGEEALADFELDWPENEYAPSPFVADFLHQAIITYKDLKALYRQKLLDDIAMEFHFRENEMRTKGYLRTIWRPLPYLWGLWRIAFLKWSYGYGSRPVWLVRYSIAVIAMFSIMLAFLTWTSKGQSGIYLVQRGVRRGTKVVKPKTWRLFGHCFYFSLLSFATFGYGALQPRQWIQFFRLEPVEYNPARWARILVGVEAALGIWVFALLITVLFGRV